VTEGEAGRIVSPQATKAAAPVSAVFLFAGSFVSMFGSDMNGIAVQWAVYEWTGREDVIALILALPILGAVLVMPWFGVFIDRSDRRAVGILLDVVRGAIVLATPLALVLGAPRLFVVGAMTFAVHLLSSAYFPNAQALVQEVSSPDRHVRYSSFFAGAIQGGSLVAGTLVGAMYTVFGLSGVLVADAATYGVSAGCYAAMRRGRPPLERAPRHGSAIEAFWSDVKEGLLFLKGAPVVSRLGAAHGLVLAGVFGLQVVTAPVNRDIFGAGPREFGYCNGAWGLGALLGSQLAGLLFRRIRPGVAFAPAMLLVALAASAIPASPSLAFGVAAFFVMGIGRGVAGVVILSRFLTDVPPYVMGRVQSAVQAFGLVLRILVMLGTGLIAENVSLPAAVLANAFLFLVAAAVAPPPRDRR